MERGTIQQQERRAKSKKDLDDPVSSFATTNIVDFDSYAIDLSQFTGVDKSRPQYYKPRERSTVDLLGLSETQKNDARSIGNIRSELHDRFSNPLYNLVFATITAAFLAQVRTTRERRGNSILIVVLLVAGIRLIGFGMTSLALTSPIGVPFMYLIPISAIAVSFYLAFTGRRLTLIDNLVRKMELMNDHILKILPNFKNRKSGSKAV